MVTYYNGDHEICFWKKELVGNAYKVNSPKFTWSDFHLIPVSRPSVSIPKVNYVVVQVPNSSKRLNITEYIPGGIAFESRSGEWQFYIDHNVERDWVAIHYDLAEYFNGTKMFASLENDNSIYEGRVYLSAYDAEETYSSVTISYDFDAEPIEVFDDIHFRIRFMSSHKTVLQEDLMLYNDTPFFRGTVANEGTLQFKNWSPAVNKVTKNVDYYPVYR